MVDLVVLRAANARRWVAAQLTRPFSSIARALVAPDAKPRYQAVSDKTGVPWFVIAVIHERESAQSWRKSLAQGDPWNSVSTHVPKGRGPFISWEGAAIDTLLNCGPRLAQHHDWSIAGALTALETYNGIGYAARGLPSPYLWAGSDQYQSGKFVRDGVFDPARVDQQPGCAGMLKAMMSLDHGIEFIGA